MAQAFKKLAIGMVAGFVVLGVLAAGESTSIAATSNTDGVAAGPASAGKPDLSRVHFEYELNPGQPAKDSVYVVNPSSTVQNVTLYARDSFSNSSGDFLLQNQNQKPTDVGSWVTFYGGKTVYTKTLKPKEFITVPFDVHTPTNASPGDHIGAIIASSTSAGSQIRVVKRVAVRLYAHVLGLAHARLEVSFDNFVVKTSLFNPFDSIEEVTYLVKNTGNVELSAQLSSQPTSFNGASSHAPSVVEIPELLPGATQKVKQVIRGVVQTGSQGIDVTYIGTVKHQGFDVQKPAGQQRLTSFAFPTGWVFWLVIIALVVVIFVFRARRIKSGAADES